MHFANRNYMNNQRAFYTLGMVFLMGAVIVGCYKSDDFINPVYNCNCGTVNYLGSEIPLKMAEIVVPDSTEVLSRSYHIVADLRTAEEVNAHAAAHDLTFHFSFPILDDVVYYVQQDDIQHLVQIINHGDETEPIRNYQATDGNIVINPGAAGEEETVEFNLTIRQEVDGDLVGLPIAFSGSFADTIE